MPIFIRNLIMNNSANGSGGGLSFYQCSGVVLNNTFLNNTSTQDGGAVGLPFTLGLRFINNIAVDNTSAQGGAISGWMAQAASFTYSDVWGNTGGDFGQGLQGGEGCISEDPLFIDMEGGNYRLHPDSPCIDAGDPDLLGDIDGSPSDMGCYSAVSIELTPLVVDPDTLDYGVAAVDSDSLKTVTITNPLPVPARAMLILPPQSVFSVAENVINLKAEGNAAFDITCSPLAEGMLVDSLSVITMIATSIGDTLSVWLPQGRVNLPLTAEGRILSAPVLEPLPVAMDLIECYPNPFNATVTIYLNAVQTGNPTLIVYSIDGAQVASLQPEGKTEKGLVYHWTPQDQAPGVYFVRVEGSPAETATTVVLLK